MQFKFYHTKLGVIVLLITCLFGTMSHEVYAGTYDAYANQYLLPTNITGADDLKQDLEYEVQRIVNAGHLAPLRTMYGETDAKYEYLNRYDTIYTLSLAYPYLSSTLQTQVKTYLKSELTTYPVWVDAYGSRFLNATVGTRRTANQVPSGLEQTETGGFEYGYRFWPKLFALYSLWLYAHNTGDWQYIETNYSTIKTWYTNNKAEVSKYYTSIAGAIGMYRLALEKPTKDMTFATSVLTDINTGMTSGTNFLQFAKNTVTDKCFSNDTWKDAQYFHGCHFIDISPEIGKYFYDNSNLKAVVIGRQTVFKSVNGDGVLNYQTPEDEYGMHHGEFEFSQWYMPQGPAFTRLYGEGSGIPTDVKAMIFPIKVWVEKVPLGKLRVFAGAPDAIIGDYYYLQNLTRTIEASGTECWEDILTITAECPTTTSPTPTTIQGNGDANNDGMVNVLDIKVVLQNWLMALTSSVDQVKDGRINALDFVRVIKQMPPV